MTTPIHPDDDPLAARLRDALSSEAQMVHPSDDGLSHIRDGIEQGQRPWWRHPGVLAVAAAAVIGLAAGGLAVALGGDGDGDNVVAGPTSPETATTASPSPSETTTEATDPPEARESVYVYYAMDDGDLGTRLYREQHSVVLAADEVPAAAAVRVMLSEPATDPDYSSGWPSGLEVLDYSVDGDTATVDVSGFVNAGSASELTAVQQLVYTVTANDNDVKRVRLLQDGGTPSSGHADWSKPVKRSSMLDVQGLVWLLTPTQDDTVDSPVQITGYGTAFEGTVSWEVREEGSDAVVEEGFAQAGSNGDFDEFSDSVQLAPGTYEMRAFESSAEDGRPLHVDSKTFTVE
jgi:hypothetical protein